jgi:hypothetical protein
MHGRFQEYFRGSDRAMVHVSFYTPRESQIAAFGEIEFLFCLGTTRELP